MTQAFWSRGLLLVCRVAIATLLIACSSSKSQNNLHQQGSAGLAGNAEGGATSGAGGVGGAGGSAEGGAVDTSSAGMSSTEVGGAAGALDAGSAGEPGNALPDASTTVPRALATLVPTGPCPDFQQGMLTFFPDGVTRQAEVLMDQNALSKDGPLIFAWFATGGNPQQAIGWFGATPLAELLAQGGILVAPYREPGDSVRPWFYTPGGPGDADDDMRLMDEVVSCAIEKVGIDPRRIHAYGMSGGGLMTVQVSYRRSSYIASVVVYSGGQVGDIPNQDPANKFAAMIVHGGATDISSVDGIAYEPASVTYANNLKATGHFAFLCDHESGHADPATLPNAAEVQASAWRFLQDHPFGTVPSPYVGGLPPGFWQGCVVSSN